MKINSFQNHKHSYLTQTRSDKGIVVNQQIHTKDPKCRLPLPHFRWPRCNHLSQIYCH